MNPTNPDTQDRYAGSMPDAGNGTTRQKIDEGVQTVKHEASKQAHEKAGAGKHRLAEEAGTLSEAIDAAASNLDDHDREGLARYARELSSTLANAAGQLEGRSVDELASDAKRLARNNPALFMLGSIAIGFGLSRFFKATAGRDHDDEDSASRGADLPVNGSAGAPMQRHSPDMTYATSAASASGARREQP